LRIQTLASIRAPGGVADGDLRVLRTGKTSSPAGRALQL
jgi:hypothetical protein